MQTQTLSTDLKIVEPIAPSVCFIEACDFETFPAGGQLAMARSLTKIFGDRLALVGMSADDTPIGQWVRREINGSQYWFLSVCKKTVSAKRPLIPARLTFYMGLRRYREEILRMGCADVFTQSPEAMLAISKWDLNSICFMFPGVENPLRISRYGYARKIWRWFDKALFNSLRKANVILACADEAAIQELTQRSNGILSRRRINQIPTCVDTNQFRPLPSAAAKAELGIPNDGPLYVTNGRIGSFKGWELIVDAFKLVHQRTPNAKLIFVGDGEDRPALEAHIKTRGLTQAISISGFQTPTSVARYLNAADVAVFGSFVEGWSVAMLEALACGKPLVSTNVSGVKDLITDANGIVVTERDPAQFAAAMENALQLKNAAKVSAGIATRFSLAWMGTRLRDLWGPFAGNPAL